nr:ribonuclease H-like domain-containing protein [Tanacetum cinerariifolium]
MESLSPQVVSTAKLHILNPNEFNLWKMRIEWKKELKARGTLLIALLDKHQLKFNIQKDAKSLMEAIEKSTNESVSAVTSVSAASTKVLVFALLNVDNLSDVVIYYFFASQSNTGLICPRWNATTAIGEGILQGSAGHLGYDWSFQADEEPTNNALMAFTSSSSLSFDNKLAPCSKACTKAYATLQSHWDIKLLKLNVMLKDNALVELRKKFKKAEQDRDELKLTLEKFQTSLKNLSKLLASQITDKIRLGYDNHVFPSTVFDCDELISFESDVSMPTSPVHDRYKSGEGYHAFPSPYTGTFMPPKPDLSNRPSAPIIKDWASDLADEYEDNPMPTHNEPSFVQTFEHVKTPRPSIKPVEHLIPAVNLRKDIPKSKGHRHSWNQKACFVCKSLTNLIKDYDYYEKKMVYKPPTNHGVNMVHPPIRRPINHRPSPKHSNFHQKVTTVKATQVNVVKGVKEIWDKRVIDSGCSRNMTGNISYFYDFEEINRGYVAFGGNLKGDTECIILSFDFKLPNENHVLLRVPKENNMYNVNLKNIVPSGDLTCLLAKATLDESNLWHRRLGHINFKAMNKLVKGILLEDYHQKFLKIIILVLLVRRESNIEPLVEVVNTACYVQNRVLVTKPYNKIPYEILLGRAPSIGFMRPFSCPVTILNTLDPLGSRPTWLFDIDTLTQFMNYQPIVVGNQPNSSAVLKILRALMLMLPLKLRSLSLQFMFLQAVVPRQRNMMTRLKERLKERVLSSYQQELEIFCEEFEDFSSNSTNGVNAASTPVTAIKPNSNKNTNTFSAAGPSNTVVSSTLGLAEKSSFVDPSQYLDDPDMPALEDITYSDDE